MRDLAGAFFAGAFVAGAFFAEFCLPWAQMVVVAGVALLVANVIGLHSGWTATRRSTAVNLRTE